MDLFEKLKGVPWGAVASVFAERVESGVRNNEVLPQVKDWLAYLTTNAVLKWTKAVESGARCASPHVMASGKTRACGNAALVYCDVCGRACCLVHARIDFNADAICEPCIGAAKQRARQAEPRAAEDVVAAAFRELGLKKTATAAEVRTAYKKLVVKYNADRPQSERQRAKNNERLKKLNAAYGVLQKHFEAEEAA